MTSEPVVLAVDLGGTTVKAGLIDATGRIHAEANEPSGERLGFTAWAEAGRRAIAKLPARSCAPVAVGLAAPGAIDPCNATMLDLVGRLPADAGVRLAEVFAHGNLPVFADNDARAGLRAELCWGAARFLTDVALFTIGTGLGSAVAAYGMGPLGGHVLAGNQLGHLTVDLAGGPCVCGNNGCAELYASATGLIHNAAPTPARTAEDVFRAADGDDAGARRAVDLFVAGLTAVVVNAIHAHQVRSVLLAGGVVGSADRFLPELRKAVTARAWTLAGDAVDIVESPFGSRISLLGAAAVAWQGLGQLPLGTPG